MRSEAVKRRSCRGGAVLSSLVVSGARSEPARRLVLRSASREGGSLKPGGGKSPPDRQRRSFVAQGFVAAHSAVPSTKNLEEPNFSTFQLLLAGRSALHALGYLRLMIPSNGFRSNEPRTCPPRSARGYAARRRSASITNPTSSINADDGSGIAPIPTTIGSPSTSHPERSDDTTPALSNLISIQPYVGGAICVGSAWLYVSILYAR